MHFLLHIILWMLPAALPAPVITPPNPTVNQGGTISFTETASDPGTWSCTGCAGSINPATGAYTAPASVTNQASLGGYQLLPNNHILNTRIDSLSVNSNSATWIAAIPVVAVNYVPTFPQNYCNASTPTQSLVFFDTPANNGPFQIPAYPFAKIEGGWLAARQYNYFIDHHMLCIDTTNGNVQETYGYYPAGAATGVEGCSTCTSQSGIRYANSSYALPANLGTDAGGMQITPLQIRLQELEQAIATSGTINHAIRTTISAGVLCSCFIWPATSNANDGQTIPFGARMRLKSTFNISGFSATAQIILKQAQQYGFFVDDGGSTMTPSVEMTRWPKAIADAFQAINVANIGPSNFEFVDESSLMIASSSGETTQNRETVKFTRTSDSATTTVDVVDAGVAVALPQDIIYIMAGSPPQTFTAFANIGSVTWTMSPTVGSLTSGGAYTVPSTEASPTSTTVTATSTTNSAIAASMTIVIMPQTTIRCVPGQSSNYTDSGSHVWYAGALCGGDASSLFSTESAWGYTNGGSWPSSTDITLYEIPIYSANDLRYDLIVPNGTYSINAKIANNSVSDQGNFVIETQGVALASPTDIFSLVGSNEPYDYNISNVGVTTGKLSFVLRSVNTAGNEIAPFLSAISITQASSSAPTASAVSSGITMTSGTTVQ